VEGSGTPFMICNDFFESFALESVAPGLCQFRQELGQGHCVVRYDPRGVGLSQRIGVGDFSIDGCVKDIVAVMAAAGLERFAMWASAIRVLCAVTYAAIHSAHVSRLILYGTYARPVDVYPPAIVESFASLARSNWDLAAQMFADMSQREQFPQEALQTGELYRKSTSGEVVAATFLAGMHTDLTPLLGSIRAATLVLHRIDDTAYPFAQAQKLASLIPEARLVPLQGSATEPWCGDSASILSAVHAFLNEDTETRGAAHLPTATAQRQNVVWTVLFTDVVAHSQTMQRLGDAKVRQLLREHERITRELLAAHGGTEVKTMGDGFMASFDSVSAAVECAIALQRAFDEWNRGQVARETAP
jgi:pimeloyl-ACP methyl ester carboxylesterase